MNPARCPSNYHHRRLLEPWSHVLTALTLLLLLVAARGGAWVEDARTKVYVQLGKYKPFSFFFKFKCKTVNLALFGDDRNKESKVSKNHWSVIIF